MKKLILSIILLVSVLTISSCTLDGGTTGSAVRQSLTAQGTMDTSDSTEEVAKTNEEPLGLFGIIKAALTRTQAKNTEQQTISKSGVQSVQKGEGEWIFLRNGTNETNCLDADYNYDLKVTLPDLGLFAVYYQNKSSEADLDHDGNVTLSDFAIFGSYYNNCDFTINESDVWCEDTDGGLNYFVRGTVTNYNYPLTNFTDYCIDHDGYSNVMEYYCMPNSTLAMTNYNCSTGNGSSWCMNGACT
ncbi:hypothetical protein HOC06_03510 [Candidatus Woesearchaeota archaeon]|nr:hypothetical protein [Candidatus Woesearchaeota archaeon]MBT4631260.1 hypothetical protein [Candidatus Woesearchaeota archaeon]